MRTYYSFSSIESPETVPAVQISLHKFQLYFLRGGTKQKDQQPESAPYGWKLPSKVCLVLIQRFNSTAQK
jgi:hypothetical protein